MLSDEEAKSAKSEGKASSYEAQLLSLQKMLDTFDEEGKTKEAELSKIKSELATAKKNYEDKNAELSALNEKHRKELETVSTDYQKEIDALEGQSGFKEK